MPAPLLLHVFPSFAVGGAQMRFTRLANHLGQACRHAIIAMDGETACRESLDPGLDVSWPAVEVRKGDALGNVRRFRRALRELQPRVLVTANWGTIEWSLANRLPHVREVHTEDGFGPEERVRQLPRRVLARRVALHRAIIVLPSLTLQRIATDIWRMNAERLHYIPNGINLAHYAPRSQFGALPGSGPVVGVVAALRTEKNLARLIRAMGLVTRERPARLVLVGDGPERPALEALTDKLGLRSVVQFAGYKADAASVYAGFDVFALSSDTEQMPLTVLEAMAAGLPVASTDVGDVAAMVSPGNRRHITALDDSALATAIGDLVDHPDLRAELGGANRAKAARDYDEATMFRAYADLLLG